MCLVSEHVIESVAEGCICLRKPLFSLWAAFNGVLYIETQLKCGLAMANVYDIWCYVREQATVEGKAAAVLATD